MDKDFYKFIKALREAQSYLEHRVISDIEKACLEVRDEAVKNAPVDTGQLRRSIQINIDREKLKGEVGTNLFYAAPLEFGADIKPRKAKVLMIPKDKKTRNLVAKYGGVKNAISAVKGRVIYQGNIAIVVVGKRVVMKFYMAKRVELKPRQFFKKAFEKVAPKYPALVFKNFWDNFK